MMHKTTSTATALIRMIEEMRKKDAEITALRQYRKRAKKAYRCLQAAYERTSAAYTALHRQNQDLRIEKDAMFSQLYQ